jgi:hypothetical protein
VLEDQKNSNWDEKGWEKFMYIKSPIVDMGDKASAEPEMESFQEVEV